MSAPICPPAARTRVLASSSTAYVVPASPGLHRQRGGPRPRVPTVVRRPLRVLARPPSPFHLHHLLLPPFPQTTDHPAHNHPFLFLSADPKMGLYRQIPSYPSPLSSSPSPLPSSSTSSFLQTVGGIPSTGSAYHRTAAAPKRFNGLPSDPFRSNHHHLFGVGSLESSQSMMRSRFMSKLPVKRSMRERRNLPVRSGLKRSPKRLKYASQRLFKHILYRQKEQFSEGVGYSWIDGLKAHAEEHVTDKLMQNAERIYPHNTPTTKEAYYYRMVFERFFPQNSARLSVPGGPSVACSPAKAIEWDSEWSNNLDPSGRAAMGVHDSAYAPVLPASFTAPKGPASITNGMPRIVGVTAPGLTIRT